MKYIKFFDSFESVNMLEIDDFMEIHKIENYSINNKGEVDVDGDFIVAHYNLHNLPFKLGKVTGNFTMDYNHLTTLEGCPEYVGGDFSVGNNDLTTLKGCPKYVGGKVFLHNNYLTNIDYFPDYVGSSIYLNSNLLKSLANLPKEINGDLEVDSNELDDIEDSPLKVKGCFNISYNEVTSLKGSPLEVDSFICVYNKLIDFKYCPKVKDSIKFGFNTELTTLKDIYTGSNGYFCNINNTNLPNDLVKLYDDSDDSKVLLNYIIKNQDDYKIWNDDGSLNEKRLTILLNER